MKTELKTLKVDQIRLGENHRSDETEELSGMMESIKSVGLLQPIGVAKDSGTKGYRVIYGFRRFFAIRKLGLETVDCKVHEDLSSGDERSINLAENLQRRNPSLAETGRWVAKLRKENNMSLDEIAVRLGIPKKNVSKAMETFYSIPEAYRDQVEQRSAGGVDLETEKIPMRTANAINNVRKTIALNKDEISFLFAEAKKHRHKFQSEQVANYAINLKNGKDIFDGVEPLKTTPRAGYLTAREWNRLRAKYVDETEYPYTTMAQIIRAILRQELAEKVDIL